MQQPPKLHHCNEADRRERERDILDKRDREGEEYNMMHPASIGLEGPVLAHLKSSMPSGLVARQMTAWHHWEPGRNENLERLGYSLESCGIQYNNLCQAMTLVAGLMSEPRSRQRTLHAVQQQRCRTRH